MNKIVGTSWKPTNPEDEISGTAAKYPELREYLAQMFIMNYVKTHFLIDYKNNVAKIESKNEKGNILFIGVFPEDDLERVK